jgi:hypothetical protein
MTHDQYGNPIETAPDGRRYLIGMLRTYKVITSGGQEIAFQGRSREQARTRAEKRLKDVHALAVAGWTLETVVYCEAMRPDVFPA